LGSCTGVGAVGMSTGWVVFTKPLGAMRVGIESKLG
jgi:hypothetical protein